MYLRIDTAVIVFVGIAVVFVGGIAQSVAFVKALLVSNGEWYGIYVYYFVVTTPPFQNLLVRYRFPKACGCSFSKVFGKGVNSHWQAYYLVLYGRGASPYFLVIGRYKLIGLKISLSVIP